MPVAVRTQIKDLIIEMGQGNIFFPTDFFHLGSVAAVNMALSRLATAGFILRLGMGIYTYPKMDPVIGILRPSLEEIALAIANKEQVTIRPTGATALLKLGLSTQVPTKIIYLTNGSSRQIEVGRGEIVFKKTTPKILAIKNDLIFLAVQAMLTLGKGNVTEEVVMQLKNRLENLDPSQIIEDAKLAPDWVRQILFKIKNDLAGNG
ncbi:DUF6088 family protein [Chitinophaga sancti]|uniref:DUF6088 family protein n=2 Tax=Chitinophaga sancti TaxID=1004 RepID=A0A1K1SHS8_9BACT|nr:DUF6088 family protein [Chitinophaga sancti]WQD61800.1 DUF6088 family protein [Chitinophaga sancti]WQG92631.1 DUF6088 family protein [Chitinophaga sancti]SFW83913.1 hypothetical protein SAMN05661012_05477 [Chitinophaga sancti]